MRHKHHSPHHGHLPTVPATVLLINNAPNKAQEKCRGRSKIKKLIDSFHELFMRQC